MSKILVIDDEDWLRDMVRMALQQRGFDVVQADGGMAGIEMAKRELPDLVLCDVNMGKMDGYSTLSAVRSQPATATIPFILMTGLADNAGMRHGMELGADDYLPKPFTLDALYAAVDTRIKRAQRVRHEAEKKLADLRTNISIMLPHELKTPLNGIIAFGEMLASTAESMSPVDVMEMGKVIYDSGKRLERLTENFLVYTQIELLAVDAQKLASLCRNHTEKAGDLIMERAGHQAAQAGREADLVLEVTPMMLGLSQEHLGKVVDEITHNAFKFSPPGTPVTVRLLNKPAWILLSITDCGSGFSPEEIGRIGAYMQFGRHKQEQQGLGLGLTIAKRLVELHGGKLAIESKEGVTTVAARFPKVEARDYQNGNGITVELP